MDREFLRISEHYFSSIPLSPLDDRYAKDTLQVRERMNRPAITRARIKVEVEYMIALSRERNIAELPPFPQKIIDALRALYICFDAEDYNAILAFEEKTDHDIKAIEYWLRKKIAANTQLTAAIPESFIHFGVTSEDISNIAYGWLIHRLLENVTRPRLDTLTSALRAFGKAHRKSHMLGVTHGQPATVTTVHEQIAVFTERLRKITLRLAKFRMHGKFGGAVGNFFAHKAAYPEVDWHAFRSSFVRSFGLRPLLHTTQINPHDDIAALSHLMCETNSILLDLVQDMWLYISRDIFREKIKDDAVGSSVMPQKINPTDWESAEGALGFSSVLFEYFARKLPISRMQRDLSDSFLQRFLGEAFAGHYYATTRILKGIAKLTVNHTALERELQEHPDIFGETIQTVMRRYGYANAYEELKTLTRGKQARAEDLVAFVEQKENIPADRRAAIAARILTTCKKSGSI